MMRDIDFLDDLEGFLDFKRYEQVKVLRF